MAVSFRCDGCGRTYKADEKYVGRTVSCKGCGRSITIQAVADDDVYGFDEPAAPLPPRPAAMASQTRPAAEKPAAAKAKKSSEFSFFGLKGAAAGVVVAVFVVLRVITVYNRIQRGNQPAPPPTVAAAPALVGAQPASAAPPAAAWTMPAIPQLGPWTEIEQGVMFQEVKLPSPAGPTTMPGHSGKIWAYVPVGQHRAQSLPCVLITGAGTKLFTGMNLAAADRAEHLPYARAGLAVVAYEMDGFPPQDENAPDAAYVEPAAAFFRARAGLVNADVAVQFAITRLNMVDSNNLYTAGHSSAATAALLVAAYDHRIAACAAYAPAIDMAAMFPTNVRPVIERIAPGAGELFTRYNPRAVENQIRCPLFLFYAEDDPRFSGQVQAMADRLTGQGKNVTLLSAPQGGHYQSMIEQGVPNAISWFLSLGGGGAAWQPLAQAPGGNPRFGPPPPIPGFNRPGIPRGGRLGPGMGFGRLGGFRGPMPGSRLQRPGMNRPGG